MLAKLSKLTSFIPSVTLPSVTMRNYFVVSTVPFLLVREDYLDIFVGWWITGLIKAVFGMMKGNNKIGR